MRLIEDRRVFAEKLRASGFEDCFSFPAAAAASLYLAQAGEMITTQGGRPDKLYYILSGRAKLYVELPNGKVSLVTFFDAPCFVGEMELLGIRGQSCAVQTLEPCYCFALDVAKCKDQLLNDARFLLHVCRYLGKKNVHNVAALSESKAFPLKNRLASFVLLTAANGVYREPHAQAAEYLGVTYRHLLFVLAELTNEGMLTKSAAGYRIENRAALTQLAQALGRNADG